jgi:hypothetical protein
MEKATLKFERRDGEDLLFSLRVPRDVATSVATAFENGWLSGEANSLEEQNRFILAVTSNCLNMITTVQQAARISNAEKVSNVQSSAEDKPDG